MASVVGLDSGALSRSPWLRRLLAPALFLVCFLLFLVWTFPFEDLARRLEHEVRAQGGELTIDRLRGAGLTGASALGVKLRLPVAQGSDPLPELRFDRVDVKVDVLQAIMRRISFAYSVEAYGGKASGHATLTKDPARQGAFDAFSLTATDLEVQALPLKEIIGVETAGRLSARIDLPKASPADQVTGQIALTLKGASLSGQVRGFTVPKLNLGDLEVNAALEKGVAKLDKTLAHNGDLDADADGTVRLRPLPSLSVADLHVRFKLGDAWLSANPVFRSLLSALNNARQPDGSFVYTLSGPISSVVPRPGR